MEHIISKRPVKSFGDKAWEKKINGIKTRNKILHVFDKILENAILFMLPVTVYNFINFSLQFL